MFRSPADEETNLSVVKITIFAWFAGEKRARQFDFMSVFEEARKTAMERSEPILGLMHQILMLVIHLNLGILHQQSKGDQQSRL